jgi:hypothetical protein
MAPSVDAGPAPWDNLFIMKKVAVLALAACFAFGLFHFFYAEDHCPVHCPSRGGRMGHVHLHHAGAQACLCFWAALSGPESADLPTAQFSAVVLDSPAPARVLGMTAPDITPPPRAVLPV